MYAKTKFRALTAFALLFLTAVILLLASDMKADAGGYGGDGCGVNGGEISWSVDTQTGVLTISGTGEMAEYSEKNEKAPWRSYRAYITSVVIEDGITNIGSYAFYTMYKIESISVPETVMRIGQYAFNGCSHLVDINIPENIKSIGESAFYGTGYYYDTSYWEKDCVLYVDGALIMTRYELDASYTVREGTKVIAEGAFSGHSELTKVTLPESVNGIGHYAFRGCSNMAEINFPQGLTEIGYRAFYRCSSLTEITVPDSVTEIGEGAFGECLSLKSITLPFVGKAEHMDMYGGVENVTIYHPFGYVFAGTSYGDRNDVKWHDVISQRSYISGLQDPWGGGGYVVPPSLKNVTVTGGVIFPGAFNNCTRVKRIVLGDGVSEIGDWAFRNCSSLDELIIGKI